jgi:hypothetical protein
MKLMQYFLPFFLSVFCVLPKKRKPRQHKTIIMFALVVIWIGYFFMYLDKIKGRLPTENRYYFILILPLLFAAWKVYSLKRQKSLEITARQQNYSKQQL